MSCPKCIEGFLLPGDPAGTIEKDFRGAYHACPRSADANEVATSAEDAQRAIILLTDGFGLPLKNCKIIADNLANRLNCDVWIPDYFDGRPLVPVDDLRTPDRASKTMSVLDWIKFILFTGIPSLPAFIHSRPAVADKRVTSFINDLKEKKHYTKLGVVGYCFGGATAVRFAGTNLVDAAVICHPAGFPIREAQAIKVPTTWACADVDIFWPRSKRLQVEAILSAKKGKEDFREYEFKDYKGTAHGFAARPNLNIPEVKEAYEQAFEQTVEWFKKTLV
ncbi:Hydrolase tropI [Psilocybe cubensis]|uniref:Dienelactone hydrolase domain-containing protein n=2 Tax=Psilocybe cubensis TaxID=181762 RepID=A0A8H7XNN1_PSICU|nr:Hydrolase tropI [Psilocybe cubensis]KAH9480083.1 Hydrolase tropI [Psilocybe cubensis]